MRRTADDHIAYEKISRNEVILEGQKRALELAVNGSRLSDVLDVLTLCVERQSEDQIFASILLIDQDGKRLLHGSAPNLPLAYNQAITGSEIESNAGSCGTAAFTKKEVVVSDISTDPLWQKYKHLALQHGLAACWSTPILSRSNDLLATFALYYTKRRRPSEADRNAVELLSRTAGIVIEWFSDIAKKREAENALKKTDQHLRALMTATSDVIYRMSADWKTMWTLYGQNFLEDTSNAIDEWQSKYLLPEDRKPIEAVINHAIKTKGTFQLEHRVIQADGFIGWTFSRAIPILDDSGNIVEWYGVATDVTNRKRNEASLVESEKQFRDFSNSIKNLAWMAHGDGWIYWYNQRWYDYTGTTLEDMQGWGWASVHHPDHVARTTEFIRTAWQTGKEWELTFPLKSKDGTYRWFLTRAYPIKDDQGKVIKWIGTNTDVNEKLRIQEELRQSEDRLRQISDFMPQIVWSTDAHGDHDFFNKRWYEFSGLTFEESKGEQWSRIVHPDDVERITSTWQRSLQTGQLYEVEFRFRRYDGEYRWILARAMPLRQANGTIERWFGTSTDIHDQKTMSQKLETLVYERTKELKRSNEDLQQFAHVSSHDLKEPVRKIQVFSNMISDRFQQHLPQQVNVNIERIKKSANRIASMIEGVLLYSSLEGSSMMFEDIDLAHIISEVATELELVIAEKNAKINYADLPIIQGVPTMIYQLFYNLINNAIKFSKSGRQPIVTITSQLTVRNGRSFHQIIIEDNGIGFSNIYSEAIFTTFTRLHSKDDYEGTGLGLALCKKIVERHGGTISATGVDGEGAKFMIQLPVDK
ncbi:PAS domain-containing protein [Fulvivirgaceae bacterium PWU4]|uniref:histidine kinase n=1 Tax=Chryseosolibacter histidini TaxID=2782349 RepID=A0AAP2DHC6_9BACT|nr:PAS domain-containing protein [Chryseosolibacter histidini]MBT1696408.1 PAS domain-containing protein [Chryseosolibacter histidini]